MPASDLPSGAWTTLGGSLSVVTCSSSSTTQVTFGGVETVLVDEDAARPDAGGHRIGAHADLLALEILRHLDAGIRPHDEAAVMEAPHEEDRQRDEGRAARARDHVGGGRQLADVELDVAHHAAERGDDRHHLDEVRLDVPDRDVCGLQGAGVAVAADRDLQARLVCHLFVLLLQQARWAPLPLVGRGWGWGWELADASHATTRPPPQPSPTRGRERTESLRRH